MQAFPQPPKNDTIRIPVHARIASAGLDLRPARAHDDDGPPTAARMGTVLTFVWMVVPMLVAWEWRSRYLRLCVCGQDP